MKPRSATTSTTPRHTQAAHINTAKQRTCFALYFLAYDLSSTAPWGLMKKYKNTFTHCIAQNLTDREYRQLQGIPPDMILGCSLPTGQPSNSLDGYRHLGELKALAQRKVSVEERARRIQLDLVQNAKNLGARDPPQHGSR